MNTGKGSNIVMKKLWAVFAMVMAFCLILTSVSALAEKSLEGDANVDQRNYPL